MINLILMLGIPGSGKSTKAAELAGSIEDSIIVSRDDIRHAEFGYPYKHSKAKEQTVTLRKSEIIENAINDGITTIIIDDTHCGKRGREESISIVKTLCDKAGKNLYYEWYLIEDSFDVDLCHKRNTSRERSVPYTVIESMFINFIDFVRGDDELCPKWLPSKALTEGCDCTNEYIVDIDGTVASHKGIRSPFDWGKVDRDLPKQHVIDVLNSLRCQDKSIVFLSGRDGSCYNKTKAWLDTHVCRSYTGLYMREEGSIEKDFIVKMRIYKEEFAQKGFRPIAVFDDRLQVVRYWRAIGLPVFQVEAGLF